MSKKWSLRGTLAGSRVPPETRAAPHLPHPDDCEGCEGPCLRDGDFARSNPSGDARRSSRFLVVPVRLARTGTSWECLRFKVQTENLYLDVKRQEVLDSRSRPRHPYIPVPVRRNG